MDEIDHPPLAKYLYGAWLARLGEAEPDLADKHWWLLHSGDAAQRETFLIEARGRVGTVRLMHARLLAAVFFALAAFGLLWVAWLIGGGGFACAATICFLLMRLSPLSSTWALADHLLLALCLFQLGATIRWGQTARDGSCASWWWAPLAGILLALCLLTKLSGAIQLGVVACAFTGMLFPPRLQLRRGIVQMGLLLCVAAGIAWWLNPAWRDPFVTLPRMFAHRAAELSNQELQSGIVFLPLWVRVVVPLRQLLFDWGLVVDGIRHPIGFALMLWGLVALAARPSSPSRSSSSAGGGSRASIPNPSCSGRRTIRARSSSAVIRSCCATRR